MGKIIAIAGKGGTGKTTTAALIIRLIKEKRLGSILAIDADPNSNLGETLGAKSIENIGKILDEISAHPDQIPQGMTKERFIQHQLQLAVQEEDGFDMISMGKPEGPGCYCYVNNILRGLITNLLNNYDYIIIDNEAGLEHLSRRTTRCADLLIVVSDATCVGLKSAQRIIELVRQLKFQVKKSFLLINRFHKNIDAQLVKETGLELLGELPADTDLEKISLKGSSIFALNPAAQILKNFNLFGEKIWRCN